MGTNSILGSNSSICASSWRELYTSTNRRVSVSTFTGCSIARHGARTRVLLLPRSAGGDGRLPHVRRRGGRDDQPGRMLGHEPVGVDDEVVVGGQLGADAVEALEVVRPSGIRLLDRPRGLLLFDPEGGGESPRALLPARDDQHSQDIAALGERQR